MDESAFHLGNVSLTVGRTKDGDCSLSASGSPSSKRWLLLFAVLLGVDLLLIWVDLALAATPERNSPYLLRLCGHSSIASLILYVKWLVGAWVLMRAAVRIRSAWIAAMGTIFVVLFLDDLLEIHEKLGAIIAQFLPFETALHLRAQDFGELAVMSGMAVLVFGALAYSIWRAPAGAAHWPVIGVFLVTGLAVSGVVFDMLHSAARSSEHAGFHQLRTLFGVIEDGGEMIWGSGLLTLAYVVSRLDRDTGD